MSKPIKFDFIAPTQAELSNLVATLDAKCKEVGLVLSEGRFIGSFRQVNFPGGMSDFRASLEIDKPKHITRNAIYKLVNSVKAARFS